MENNQYYYPKLEEFVDGFEYEKESVVFQEYSPKFTPMGPIWEKKAFRDGEQSKEELEQWLRLGMVRAVKKV